MSVFLKIKKKNLRTRTSGDSSNFGGYKNKMMKRLTSSTYFCNYEDFNSVRDEINSFASALKIKYAALSLG